MIGYTSFEILSGNVAAIDLGITSEISIITIVTIADAIPHSLQYQSLRLSRV